MTVSARLRAARGLVTAFAATSAAHLGAIATGSTVLQNATKPALMPLLAAHSLASAERAPKLLAPALLASTAGDVLLQLGGDTAFLAGMGSFAAAHVAYVTMFARQGAFSDGRRTMLVAAGYAAAWAAVITQLWPDLGSLQIPVAVYSLLLASTAVSSAGLGLATGIGGGLFLLSDSLIAVRLAGWKLLPGHNVLVMATYIAAQYLLARGALRAEETRTAPPEARTASQEADEAAGTRLGAPA